MFKLNLSQKILLGFVVCTIVLAGVAVFSFRNSEKFINTNQWVNHTYEVIYEFDQILAANVDMETATRGFVVTGEDVYLEPYTSGRIAALEHIDFVKRLTVDNLAQQANIELLQKAVEGHIQFREGLVAARRSDFGSAQKIVLASKDKQLMDEIRRLISQSKKMEQSLLAERRTSSEEDARDFNTIFIILLLVIAVVLVAVYIIINTNLKALKKAEQESSNKNWLLTGNFELNEKIRGEQEVSLLTQAAITQLCTYLKAQIGVIYLAENAHFRMMGSYAYQFRKQHNTIVNPGEGLVGQVVLEKKPIVFTEVPADYVKINSGLGNATPSNIILFPLLQDNVVRGVVEIGTARQITQLEMELLNMVAENMAIVFGAAQSREKLKELLEETQRQAEELETQQEELKQTNEELTEKTGLLEKSEAELKTQQEELQQSNEELEEKANLLEEQKERLELTKMDLENKARELEVTSKYKSEFLANMSHELRTPLNSILILSQLLSENKSKALGSKEVEFSRNIYSSGADLLSLINEILDLSKVEAGKMELEIAEVPISEVDADINAMFAELAKSKSIAFSIQHEGASLKSITTDKQRLEQILRNLLSNAFKFTPAGGEVTMTIRKTATPGAAKGQHPDFVQFEVTDTGIGISPAKQGIVFEAFQQADGSTKRKYGGTGLGLSISRELAIALGGEIRLQSAEGQGSTFTLLLPVVLNEARPAVPTDTARPDPTPAKRQKAGNPDQADNQANDDRYNISGRDKVILIMEDDPQFANILLDFVRGRNYKVIVAGNGSSGLSYARQFKPDAIILDMKLPLMDGVEVLKHLKNDPSLRHIPVQIFSGYDMRKEGLELGAFDFLQKPVSRDDMKLTFDKIEQYVSKKLKRLLVVEDNEKQNKAIIELIGNGDVKSDSAFSGREAYEKMTAEHFDCMIIDLGLPDMTGFDLLEKIKTNEKVRRVPVIVYTGRDLTKEENMRLSKLANTVVLKTANSQERLLDETMLFLHRVESNLPKEKQTILRKLHKSEEVLKDRLVLIVDDDIRNVYSLTNVLGDEGMKCLTAENGAASIKALKENPGIEIILMDVMMPEMDGYEATKSIRSMSKFEKIPIIALTAKAMKGDREKCLEAGMSDYVAKPVNIDQLLSLMRVWLYR